MNTAMIDLSMRYKLPSIFRHEGIGHEYRIFIFKDATDESVQASALIVEQCKEITKVTAYCVAEISTETLQHYATIFDETISDTRDIDITFEDGVPVHILEQMCERTHRNMQRRSAILN